MSKILINLMILAEVGNHPEGVTAAEIAEKLSLGRLRVSRILTHLREINAVRYRNEHWYPITGDSSPKTGKFK